MKFKTIIILAASYLLFISCGDVPVFSEMDTNRLKIVIKGTLETEGKSNFVPMNGQSPSALDDNSVVEHPGAIEDALPETFMFDIAELRLNGKKFANYRQVMEASLTDSPESFFDGQGIELDNDDPAPGYYDTVQVYVRKMIFDGANIFRSSENSFEYDNEPRVIFNEEYRDGGFDFNQYQQNTYVDSLKLNARDYLRSFPIRIPIIGGLNYDKNDKETVLEIRFVIKNFIKKYELPFYDSGVYKLYHFYALSDWLREVEKGDVAFGGNLLAVARAYVPGKTGSVTVNAGANQYVIAIPEGEDINDYFIPDRTLPNAAGMRGFSYDLPQPPQHPGYRNIEALLDYYIKYEEYKSKWNVSLASMPADPALAFDEYVDAWDGYDEAVSKFKIAPYVGYSGGGTTVTFTNMAPGEYNFYKTGYDRTNPSFYGKLFEGASPFTPAGGNPVIINNDKIAANPDINIP